MANNLIACGGTFDHFHKGHEAFLSHALSLGGKLIVGLTSDEYIKNFKFQISNFKLIENYEIRKRSLEEFFRKEKALNRVEIVKIDDLFGPTLGKNLDIDAIVVSHDSKKGAGIINEKRRELGLKDLTILVAPLVLAEDGRIISSARIRNGEINRAGKPYVNPLWLKTDLVLPENLREEFRKPFGELLAGVDNIGGNKNSLIITVGDETSRKFNRKSIKQSISVVDFKIARRETFSSFSDLGFSGDEQVITEKNPAGHIMHGLFSIILDIIKSDFNKRIILKILGEDDLAVLPLILAAPLNAIIYYGQPNRGLVKVIVSEDSKNKAYNLVSKLKSA